MTYFYEIPERVAALLGEASRWVGTPFRKRAIVMGHGVDCVGLAIAVYRASGLPITPTVPHYHFDEGQHSAKSKVVEWLTHSAHFVEVQRASETASQFWIGDALCFRTTHSVHHVGVFLGGTRFIHAIPNYGVRIANVDDSTYAQKIDRVFRPIA